MQVTLHTYTDKHGTDVSEPVLVRTPGEAMDTVCDVDLLQQIGEFGGSVAIIREGNLGDILMLTPTLRELKRQLPKLQLHVYSRSAFLRVYRGNTNVALCGSSGSKESRNATYSVDLRGYVEREQDADIVDRTTLFGRAFGLDIEDGAVDFVVEEEDKQKAFARLANVRHTNEFGRYVVIAPDSTSSCRCMSEDCLSRLERAFEREHYAVVVTGHKRGVFPELGELGALTEMADAVVSMDNGVYHIASTNKTTKLFPIFTSIRPELRCCWYDNCYPYVTTLPCSPCNERPSRGCHDECVASLDAENICEHVIARLESE